MNGELVTSVTSKGQVTIPAEVRRRLGIEPGDKVSFQVEDGTVRLERVKWTVDEMYGSIEPLERPEDWEARIEAAREEHLARRHRSG